METISKEDARNFLVNYQGLNGAEKRKGLEGVLDYFNKVRCVQFDPLDVVGRNADLVLQSRVTNYRWKFCKTCFTKIAPFMTLPIK